jgi:hypothetical protein
VEKVKQKRCVIKEIIRKQLKQKATKKNTIGLLFTLLSLNINKQNKSCLIDLDISKL